jgi:hypothetical protein
MSTYVFNHQACLDLIRESSREIAARANLCFSHSLSQSDIGDVWMEQAKALDAIAEILTHGRTDG